MGAPDSTFFTDSIHAGYRPDVLTGAVNVPIYTSTTFAQDGVNELRGGYEYGRCGNPTTAALEKAIAALEGAEFARAFSSGMAATDTVVRALTRPGSHVIVGADVYGGTFRLLDSVFRPWGVELCVVDTTDPGNVRAAVRENTALVWLETPTNPMLGITDVARVAEALTGTRARLVVDNTFATPYLQRPLELGADVVVHSTTKYLGGHSDVIGGLVVTNSEQVDSQVADFQGWIGAIPGPFDSYLALRGIKTLGVRMQRHCQNAQQVAEYLDQRPEVTRVHYPGLPHDPGYEVARRQMAGFGGMISVQLAGGEDAARRFCAATRLICLAESLGGVESLIEHPATMTHQSAAGSVAAPPRDLVRISIGLEDAGQLIADCAQALDRL
ncbi:cystathionine gamma-synthase [Corynebacterium atypicum]|uniref:Cystathionine gamma-synthase n=1 Tax=Corynebacterium atypicum TaxID=191610 RepID=A0ABN4DDS7_9CORY|nr:cystathionine gamma-synthase [Corynebacterium atypicum]AIG64579.1 cystathionine gamma-synthase [Corynebacterium atypicum]